MQNSAKELWMAFITILALTIFYLFVVLQTGSIPAARGFFGHSLGILGFTLMLMTELLYSRRKRSRSARWGSMAAWLRFHIFTGLVGPYMVLLHSSWKFNGLAGIVILLTLIIVLSGFVGRYIYTAIPRTVDGAAIEASTLEKEVARTESALLEWITLHPETGTRLQALTSGVSLVAANPVREIFGRGLREIRDRLAWKRLRRRFKNAPPDQLDHLERLLKRQRVLRRQVNSLAVARRMLGLWHIVHVPIGVALFTTAFLHVVAAIYYATLLR